MGVIVFDSFCRTRCYRMTKKILLVEDDAVIREAKEAGVYVFGGGIDESVAPILVSANGSFTNGGYPWAPPLTKASILYGPIDGQSRVRCPMRPP